MSVLQNETKKISSLTISIGIHVVLIMGGVLTQVQFSKFIKTDKVNVDVFVQPKMTAANLNLQPQQKPEQKPAVEEVKKKVFGLSRKAITTSAASDSSVTEKLGNTVAKENDQLKLNEDDPDSIPIPTDDYLITTNPALEKEIKIPYPEEAKKAGVEGPVVMNLLIDKNGIVKDVQVIKGPGYGLNEAAKNALYSFKFKPAKVSDKSVAVLIRYTYRFVLEAR